MKIAVPKETKEKENRVALTPDIVQQLVKAGFECVVESGAGNNSYMADAKYIAAGAQVVADKQKLYGEADVVLRVNAPSASEIAMMKRDAVLISFIWAASNPELVAA